MPEALNKAAESTRPLSVALTLVAVAEAPQIVKGYLPDLQTFVKPEGEAWTREQVRKGYLIGGGLAVGTALIAGYLVNSPAPFLGALLSTALVVGIYEHEIREVDRRNAADIEPAGPPRATSDRRGWN